MVTGWWVRLPRVWAVILNPSQPVTPGLGCGRDTELEAVAGQDIGTPDTFDVSADDCSSLCSGRVRDPVPAQWACSGRPGRWRPATEWARTSLPRSGEAGASSPARSTPPSDSRRRSPIESRERSRSRASQGGCESEAGRGRAWAPGFLAERDEGTARGPREAAPGRARRRSPVLSRPREGPRPRPRDAHGPGRRPQAETTVVG
jgi:hypothetical protein